MTPKQLTTKIITIWSAPRQIETEAQGRLFMEEIKATLGELHPVPDEIDAAYEIVRREWKYPTWPGPQVWHEALNRVQEKRAEVRRAKYLEDQEREHTATRAPAKGIAQEMSEEERQRFRKAMRDCEAMAGRSRMFAELLKMGKTLEGDER